MKLILFILFSLTIISQQTFGQDEDFEELTQQLLQQKLSIYYYGVHMMEHEIEEFLDILEKEYGTTRLKLFINSSIYGYGTVTKKFDQGYYNLGLSMLKKENPISKKTCFELIDRLSVNLFFWKLDWFTGENLAIGKQFLSFFSVGWTDEDAAKFGKWINLFVTSKTFEGNGVSSETTCVVNLSTGEKFFEYK